MKIDKTHLVEGLVLHQLDYYLRYLHKFKPTIQRVMKLLLVSFSVRRATDILVKCQVSCVCIEV